MIRRLGTYTFWIGVACLLINIRVTGQLSRAGRPFPIGYSNTPDALVYPVNVIRYGSEIKFTHRDSMLLKPARSGSLAEVEFKPATSGAWDTLDDGTKIWRAGFTVKDASLMNLIFSPYKVTGGVRIFLYDPSQENIIGALSDLNNKPHNRLATANIPGSTLIVEMQVPAYIEDFGELAITGIGCDFTGDGIRFKKDEWFGSSGFCNEDILCESNPMINKVKNSVVRIVFLGHERCTGSLVNTTQNKNVHYILTAGHCFKNEEEANTAVFYFQYESPVCDGPDGNSARSLSGATIRARSDDIDFALLELLEPVPFTYHPYYAGWDYTDAPPQSGFVIHHPLGDVKKIAYEEHPLTVSTFGSLYNDNSHWLVSHWESGTTEAGSSGAPLFDYNGRVKGTLTGGLAKCDNPVKDYFQMFSHSWKDFSTPEEQLAVWLDPLKNSHGFLDGYDPYAAFWLTGDTLSNIPETEILSIESDGLDWGSYSGHNSLQTSEFAEKFVTSGVEMINGVHLNVRDNFISRSNRFLNIKIWNGTELPGAVIYEKAVPLENFIAGTMNFIEFDSVVHPGTTFFAGFELFYPSTQDTFSVYMAENRAGSGSNTAFVSDGFQWTSLSNYTSGAILSSFAIFPVVFGSLPDDEITTPEDYVTVYPNPASSDVRLIFRQMKDDPVHITVFNMQGQTVIDKEYGPYQHIVPLDLLGIAGGFYIIRVKQGGSQYNVKIAVVK